MLGIQCTRDHTKFLVLRNQERQADALAHQKSLERLFEEYRRMEQDKSLQLRERREIYRRLLDQQTREMHEKRARELAIEDEQQKKFQMEEERYTKILREQLNAATGLSGY